MIESERIHIPPKRTRLGLDRPDYRWRHLGFVLLALSLVSGAVWLVLK